MFSGASPEEIRSSYKRLALKWHPDKHNNSQEATKVHLWKLFCMSKRKSLLCAQLFVRKRNVWDITEKFNSDLEALNIVFYKIDSSDTQLSFCVKSYFHTWIDDYSCYGYIMNRASIHSQSEMVIGISLVFIAPAGFWPRGQNPRRQHCSLLVNGRSTYSMNIQSIWLDKILSWLKWDT